MQSMPRDDASRFRSRAELQAHYAQHGQLAAVLASCFHKKSCQAMSHFVLYDGSCMSMHPKKPLAAGHCACRLPAHIMTVLQPLRLTMSPFVLQRTGPTSPFNIHVYNLCAALDLFYRPSVRLPPTEAHVAKKTS